METTSAAILKIDNSKPFFGKELLDPVHGAQGHIQGFSHLGRWPTVVALEENPGL